MSYALLSNSRTYPLLRFLLVPRKTYFLGSYSSIYYIFYFLGSDIMVPESLG